MTLRQRIRFLSLNPGKRATERFYLVYTAVWGTLTAALMLSGAAVAWGDVPLMAWGVGLWLPVLVVPLLRRAPEDRQKPFHRLYGFKMHACLLLMAAGGCTITFYFYEVLHMHYGFRTQWNLNNVPLFLYFLTVAYFATYSVLLFAGYRFLNSLLPERTPRPVRALMAVPVSLAVALLETLTHATPLMRHLFCYDDVPFMLWFGTPMYAVWFVVWLGLWFPIDERPGDETPLGTALLRTLLAFALIVAASEIARGWIAPSFTTVVIGAPGLRDYGDSCLLPL